ncbi:MAG: hypothetical protein Q8L24_02320 [bacterium]|nr:hypothetical protein [bacterium]
MSKIIIANCPAWPFYKSGIAGLRFATKNFALLINEANFWANWEEIKYQYE